MIFSKDTGGGGGGKKNVNEPKCLYKKAETNQDVYFRKISEPKCLFQKNQRTKMFILEKL